MIVVRIKGGLGNQMFQYAAAKQLAVRLKMTLKFDTQYLKNNKENVTKRIYELDKFNIDAQFATHEDIKKVKKNAFIKFFGVHQLKDWNYKIIKLFLKSTGNYYMNGYWQSEKYFSDIEKMIRRDFTFREPLKDNYFLYLQESISKLNSVSIHFRRGDYVFDKKANKHHGVCSIGYYQKAVERIAAYVEEPHFFIFSDDISWVKQNFHIGFPVSYIEKSDEILHSDFRLMSLCKHNIIANSSYSWWAAWLNKNVDKIIIAPQQWYQNKWKQLSAKDRVSKSWIRI